MPRRVAVLYIALLLTGLLSGDARAQAKSEEDTQRILASRDYTRGGYFIAATGLFALENSPIVDGPDTLVASGGFDIRLGNRHRGWFATEIVGVYVNRFVGANDSFLAWGLSLNERLYLTKARVQPFLLAGVGFLQVRARDDEYRGEPGEIDPSPGFTPGFAARFGVGAETYTTENFAISLDFIYYLTAGHIKDHDFVTVGLGLQFF